MDESSSEGRRLLVHVLGPVRVVGPDGTDLTPSGALQRRLLALLVLRRDRVVAPEQAIDALWPNDPPRDEAAALHNQVFRLRRRLPGLVESVGDGYVLRSAQVRVDAEEVAAAVGSAARDATVLASLQAVLDGWQGSAYPELADLDDGRAEASRLDELRVRAREVQAECRLAAGDVEAAVPELHRLVDEEPLRERPRSLLMAALEQAGRRVEAMRAYDDFRRLLGAELGIEPSPALVAQHAALLADAAGPAGPTSRLPAPTTSLVGRDPLTAEVAAAVEAHRVVTLVGPAGVGKTRLAVEAGHRLQETAEDRPVVLCELGAAGPASVVEQVAAELQIDARAGISLRERIAEALGEQPLVLVLDGCEHVLDPMAALVEKVVARCPHVHVVATSRERLRVPGERVVPVPPLPCEGAGAAAVELFVDRARAVAPGFDPAPEELEAVAEIARRLDGLPLAIELAAARLHTHALAEVGDGIDHRFTLLSSGYRGSARHGSLRAAVSWSYELLDDRLRRVFADLSVFAGSFTLADAAAVTDAAEAVVADDLVQLVERSLLARTGAGRFALLETLRAFGAEQLEATGRSAEVRARHADRMVAWAHATALEAAAPTAPGSAVALLAIDAAVPDLRAALGCLLEVGHLDRASALVGVLRQYGFLRQRPDVLAWAARVTEVDPEGHDPAAPVMWAMRGYASWLTGDVEGSSRCATRAWELASRFGDPHPQVLAAVGSDDLFAGRLVEAADWYRRSAERAAEMGDEGQRLLAAGSQLLALGYAGDPSAGPLAEALLAEVHAQVTPFAAYVWHCAGEADLSVDLERARQRFACALELAERTGATLVVGLAGASIASIDARSGDPQAAVEAYRWLVPHWRRSGVWSTQWTMLRSIAVLLDRLGRHRDAAVLEGAVRATGEGHRIFGADAEVLAELGARLRAALGVDAYEAARREGGALDGNAAADHALRSLA